MDVAPERGDQFRERPAGFGERGDDLREDAGAVVGVEGVAEVEVPGEFATDDRRLLRHPRLHEDVADPLLDGAAAGLLDRLAHGSARSQVVHDCRAGLLREESRHEPRQHQIARHGLAAFVDHHAAVRVAIEAEADRRLAGDDRLARLRQVRLDERIRFVGELARLVVEVELRELQPLHEAEELRHHRAGHAVGGVDDHLERSLPRDQFGIEKASDVVAVGVPEIARLLASPLRLDLLLLDERRETADLLEPRAAPDGLRAAARDLEAVVVRRIVRGGHLHPTRAAEQMDGEVDHRGVHPAEVDHMGSVCPHPLPERLREGRRTLPHVAADHQMPHHGVVEPRFGGLFEQQLGRGVADLPGDLLVQGLGIGGPNVVGLEDFAEHVSLRGKGSGTGSGVRRRRPSRDDRRFDRGG